MVPEVIPARPDLGLVLALAQRAPVLLPRRVREVLVDGALVPREVVLGTESVVEAAAARLGAEEGFGVPLVVFSKPTVSWAFQQAGGALAYFRTEFVFTISWQYSHCSLALGFVPGAAELAVDTSTSRGSIRSNATRPNCDAIRCTSGSKISSPIDEMSSMWGLGTLLDRLAYPESDAADTDGALR